MSSHPAAAYHRKRKGQVDEKIREAAARILRHAGFAHFTVEAVASSSGVAKTTIYRRSENSLQLAALALGLEDERLMELVLSISDAAEQAAAELEDDLGGAGTEILLRLAEAWRSGSRPA